MIVRPEKPDLEIGAAEIAGLEYRDDMAATHPQGGRRPFVV